MICTWSNAVEHLKLFNIDIHFHSSAYKLFSLRNRILSTWLMKSIIIITGRVLKLLFVHARGLIITIRIWRNARNITGIVTLTIPSNSMISIFRTLSTIDLLRLRDIFRFDLSVIFFDPFTVFLPWFFCRLGFWFYFNHMCF